MLAWGRTDIWYFTHTSLKQTQWKKRDRKTENHFRSFGPFPLLLHSLSREAGGPEASSCSVAPSQFPRASFKASFSPECDSDTYKISVFYTTWPYIADQHFTWCSTKETVICSHRAGTSCAHTDRVTLVFNLALSSGFLEEWRLLNFYQRHDFLT